MYISPCPLFIAKLIRRVQRNCNSVSTCYSSLSHLALSPSSSLKLSLPRRPMPPLRGISQSLLGLDVSAVFKTYHNLFRKVFPPFFLAHHTWLDFFRPLWFLLISFSVLLKYVCFCPVLLLPSAQSHWVISLIRLLQFSCRCWFPSVGL